MAETYSHASIALAKAQLERAGYVVVKEKSHRQAQERQRLARVMQESAEENLRRRAQTPWDHTLRLIEAFPPVERICQRCQCEVTTRRYPDLDPPAVFHDCFMCGLTWEEGR